MDNRTVLQSCLLSNFHNLISIRLDNSNYVTWKFLVETMLAGYGLFGYIDGSFPCPPQEMMIEEGGVESVMAKEYKDWVQNDSAVSSILVATLSSDALSFVIGSKSSKEILIKVFNGRKALAHSLTDTKTAVKQLDKLVTAVLVIITTVVWLLLVEIANTKVLVFLSSQLVLAAFMFGNTCKTIFEAIIFVFVMHPFDVGDRCVVEGVELMVEEMNILTTVFLKLNQEKVYYPNSVLSTKPISNYYRSSNMGDIVEFSIAFSTPLKKIGQLKEKVQEYVEGNPTLWHPNHAVVVVEIENMNKLKMALYFCHTMNFQDWVEKQKRRSEIVMALKKCFDELQITYYLLPLEVRLTETNVTKK